jgi:acyl dehydratase
MVIGWVGEFLEAWAGRPENIVTWGIRFTSAVWPGDRLVIDGEELDREVTCGGVRLRCSVTATRSADGETVARATAVLAMPKPDAD